MRWVGLRMGLGSLLGAWVPFLWDGGNIGFAAGVSVGVAFTYLGAILDASEGGK